MNARMEKFLGLSAVLTGFGRVELFGTAMATTYLQTLDTALPKGVVDELLAAYDPGVAQDAIEAAVNRMLEDPKLGPVARNLMVLWYCGSWTCLPDGWCAAYGPSRLDVSRVLSADAYQAGLQWIVAGAHPAGARQQGFGAWAMAPEGSGL